MAWHFSPSITFYYELNRTHINEHTLYLVNLCTLHVHTLHLDNHVHAHLNLAYNMCLWKFVHLFKLSQLQFRCRRASKEMDVRTQLRASRRAADLAAEQAAQLAVRYLCPFGGWMRSAASMADQLAAQFASREAAPYSCVQSRVRAKKRKSNNDFFLLIRHKM